MPPAAAFSQSPPQPPFINGLPASPWRVVCLRPQYAARVAEIISPFANTYLPLVAVRREYRYPARMQTVRIDQRKQVFPGYLFAQFVMPVERMPFHLDQIYGVFKQPLLRFGPDICTVSTREIFDIIALVEAGLAPLEGDRPSPGDLVRLVIGTAEVSGVLSQRGNKWCVQIDLFGQWKQIILNSLDEVEVLERKKRVKQIQAPQVPQSAPLALAAACA